MISSHHVTQESATGGYSVLSPLLVSQLKGILMWPDIKLELLKDESLQDLHDMGSQCHKSVILGDHWNVASLAQELGLMSSTGTLCGLNMNNL